jgi:integrase
MRSAVRVGVRPLVGNSLLVRLLGNKSFLRADFCCAYLSNFRLFGLVLRLHRPPNMSTKVWTDKKGTTLRLRWLFEGKRYQLPLGVKDNVTGTAYAKIVAGTIERDIECGNFDQTKERYQNPNKRGRKPKVEISKITAVQLFKAYAADRLLDRNLSHSSTGRLKGIASKLKQFLGDKPATQVTEAVARDMLARWFEKVLSSTIKERLRDLSACWDWARDKYTLAGNRPYFLERLKT